MTKIIDLTNSPAANTAPPLRILALEQRKAKTVGLCAALFQELGHVVQWSPSSFQFNPDLVWLDSWGRAERKLAAEARGLGARVVLFSEQNPFSIKNQAQLPNLELIVPLIDAVVTTRSRTITDFAALGIRTVFTCAPPVWTERLLDLPMAVPKLGKCVIYVGSKNKTVTSVVRRIASLANCSWRILNPAFGQLDKIIGWHANQGDAFLAMPDDRALDDIDPFLPFYMGSGVRFVAEDCPGQRGLVDETFVSCQEASLQLRRTVSAHRDIPIHLRSEFVARELISCLYAAN